MIVTKQQAAKLLFPSLLVVKSVACYKHVALPNAVASADDPHFYSFTTCSFIGLELKDLFAEWKPIYPQTE